MRTRSPAARAIGLAILVGSLGATRAGTDGRPGQEPSTTGVATFATAVDVILVDAVVIDAQGRLVKGLTADDFVIHEDGEPQLLTSFESVDLASVPATDVRPSISAMASRASANDGGEAAESPRVFLVVMDDASFSLGSAAAARKAATRFLSEAVRAGDLVTIVVPGEGLSWPARLPEGMSQLASIVDSVQGLRAVTPELAGDWEARQISEAFDPLTQERARVRLDSAGRLPRAPSVGVEGKEAYDARNRIYQEPFLQADARRQLDRGRERPRRNR